MSFASNVKELSAKLYTFYISQYQADHYRDKLADDLMNLIVKT